MCGLRLPVAAVAATFLAAKIPAANPARTCADNSDIIDIFHRPQCTRGGAGLRPASPHPYLSEAVFEAIQSGLVQFDD